MLVLLLNGMHRCLLVDVVLFLKNAGLVGTFANGTKCWIGHAKNDHKPRQN